MRRLKLLPVLSFIGVFLLGFVGSVTFFTFRNTLGQVIVTVNPTATSAQATPTPTPDPMAPYGVLLLGYRGDNSRGGYLTDTMMLAIVEPRKKTVNLVSIPRDLWVAIPTTKDSTTHYKINNAYVIGLDDKNFPNKPAEYTGAAGGGTLAKTIVADIFGIPVHYFISLDFEGFKKSIDILGGVDVTVSRPFEDPFYPITGKEDDVCEKSEEDVKQLTATLSGELLEQSFSCRYEHLKFDRGLIHMDGETALKYARSRHSLTEGSDFARSTRQKQIMIAVKDKILQIGFLPKALPFIQSLAGDLRTDIPLDTMRAYISQVNELKTYQINSISLSTENALTETYSTDRQYILIPKSGIDNWESVREYVLTQLDKVSPSQTPSSQN